MKLTKKLAISFSLLLMAILFSQNSFGYAFTQDYNNGFYWKAFPIQMKKFVALSSDSALLDSLANDAFSEWEMAVGKNLWDVLPVEQSSNYSGNYIRWSDNFGSETGFDPSRTLAITIRYSKGTFFERVEIVLNGNLSYLRQNMGNTLKTTLLHEIGHTIGLDHSSQQAIMSASISSITTLQQDDIDGMIALVDSSIKRHESGYVSPLSTSSGSSGSKLMAGCGSVEDASSTPKNFIGAGLIGLIIAYVFKPRNAYSCGREK